VRGSWRGLVGWVGTQGALVCLSMPVTAPCSHLHLHRHRHRTCRDPLAGGDSSGSGPPGRDSPPVEKQKKRTPAWCDRVLWLPGRQLYQLAYGRGELAVRCGVTCDAFDLARPCTWHRRAQRSLLTVAVLGACLARRCPTTGPWQLPS
jgi:hypothetical protein